jgi:beta-glucosidase-like glycosyl hydrolase
MAKPQTLELCRLHLFDDVDKLKKNSLSQQAIDRILRLRAAFNLWNKYPLKKEAEIRDFIMKHAGVEKTAAYEDIQILKILLGDFQETSKEFHRFRFNHMIDKAFEMAERKQDARGMATAAGHYAKYNKIDQEEAVKIPYEDIVPQTFEPTSDPTVIGIKPIPNIREKIAGMKRKYMADIAEDITFEETDFNEEEFFADEKENLL